MWAMYKLWHWYSHRALIYTLTRAEHQNTNFCKQKSDKLQKWSFLILSLLIQVYSALSIVILTYLNFKVGKLLIRVISFICGAEFISNVAIVCYIVLIFYKRPDLVGSCFRAISQSSDSESEIFIESESERFSSWWDNSTLSFMSISDDCWLITDEYEWWMMNDADSEQMSRWTYKHMN